MFHAHVREFYRRPGGGYLGGGHLGAKAVGNNSKLEFYLKLWHGKVDNNINAKTFNINHSFK